MNERVEAQFLKKQGGMTQLMQQIARQDKKGLDALKRKAALMK